MLLKFTLNGRQLILNNPEALVRESQISFIQCQIDLRSRIFKAGDTLIAVFKSASYNIEEEVLLDVHYDVENGEVVRIYSFAHVPSKVFEHGGVIQLLIYKYKEKMRSYHQAQDSTNTVEFYMDPRKYVPLRTSALWQQLANEIEEVRSQIVTDYNMLGNKPSIEHVTLEGNKMFPELELNVLTNTEIQNIFDNLI